MSSLPTAGHSWSAERIITILWGLAVAAAVVNQAAGAAKAAIPEPTPQKEKTVRQAAVLLMASPPPDGRTLVVLNEAGTVSEDSLYFSYRLQYLIYPQRVDRYFFPWEGLIAETYRSVFLCDDLMLLRPSDVESQSGTVYHLRTPISTDRLRGGAK